MPAANRKPALPGTGNGLPEDSRCRGRILVLAAAVLFLTGWVGAAEYYLSPAGDDAGPGTRANPWRTLEKASVEADAGDIITLLPGDYDGVLRPANSGKAGKPIVFRAEPRRGARLVGNDRAYRVWIEDREHIRLEGLHVHQKHPRGMWIMVRDSSHVAIDDLRAEGGQRFRPLRIVGSEQVRLTDSFLHRRDWGGDMVRVEDSRRVLVEGNSFSRCLHTPISWNLSSRWVVARGNVFHAAWARNFEFFSTRDVLFEHNIVTNSFNGGRSAGPASKCLSENSIFRFNRIFRNWGGPLSASPYRDTFFFSGARLYNNVFDDNAEFGMTVRTDHENVSDVLFVNNIFSRNDRWGDYRQIALLGGGPEILMMLNNVFTADKPGRLVIQDGFNGGAFFSVRTAESHPWVEQRYKDNFDVTPGYADPETYNHALSGASPLRDGGRHLTRAVDSGEGTELPVEDALYFYDGFGIEGEKGDLIAVGNPGQAARIIKVDRENSLLILERPVSWDEGDPVSLPWAGDAPDIGVYEHGDVGRPGVQVITEPFFAEPGQEVAIRAVLHGDIEPAGIKWMLGDEGDTVAEGLQVRHVYGEEYDYGIRVRVSDARGGTHVGTGYVIVEKPAEHGEPLMHSTFCEADSEWIWRWQIYRPRPVKWEQILESESGKCRIRIEAPEDGTRMPCWTFPAGWDIDRFPQIRVRYRAAQGIPLALRLRAFSTVESSDREVFVAATPGAYIPGESRGIAEKLYNDEGWHELIVDARLVREVFPDVQVLEGLKFKASRWRDREKVMEGHWYEIGEVYIGPG